MCFNIHREYREERIASKDIVCYKRLQDTFEFTRSGSRKKILDSPYMHHSYVMNQLYSIPSLKKIYGDINEGFHMYTTKEKADKHWVFYSVNTYRCVIPQGASYYINPESQECVSNQLIIKRKI